jgi:hypothetical protein
MALSWGEGPSVTNNPVIMAVQIPSPTSTDTINENIMPACAKEGTVKIASDKQRLLREGFFVFYSPGLNINILAP